MRRDVSLSRERPDRPPFGDSTIDFATGTTSPHLRNDDKASPLGIALWNLVCGEHPQT